MVEIQLIELFNADLFQPMRARLCRHQAKGRGIGGKELARVRLKGHDTQGRFWCGLPRQINDRAMAAVDAIEIADRDGGPAILVVNKLIITDDAHGVSLALSGGWRKGAVPE
ncbi:hypothetical protein SCH4B_1618 [Ruegeria sp. TrichCH4B]|nr:hypothetical protein SCH4B_1618 [Ruegeria sp. TrichCH4B]